MTENQKNILLEDRRISGKKGVHDNGKSFKEYIEKQLEDYDFNFPDEDNVKYDVAIVRGYVRQQYTTRDNIPMIIVVKKKGLDYLLNLLTGQQTKEEVKITFSKELVFDLSNSSADLVIINTAETNIDAFVDTLRNTVLSVEKNKKGFHKILWNRFMNLFSRKKVLEDFPEQSVAAEFITPERSVQ